MATPSPHVIEATSLNFRAAVVERSLEVPVLVDFWAPWCGPCKALGPLLEKLADEYGGAFLLAKVDTDKEQELAEMFQIQSIPSVKLIAQGRLVDGFDGALPEAALRKFLEAHVQPAGDPFAQAKAAFETDDLGAAKRHVEAALAKDPQRAEARFLSAEITFAGGDIEGARAALDAVPDDLRNGNPGRSLRARIELAGREPGDLEALARAAGGAEPKPAALIAYGKALAAAGRFEEALDVLLTAVQRDRDFDDQAARRAMLEVFDALGSDSDVASDFRRQLQMALFV